MRKLVFIYLVIQLLSIGSYSQNTLDKIGLTAATPAGAAYSVRLLSSTYAGPAMQVRRSSDSELRDVYFDATGVVSLNSQVSAAGGGAATATILTTWLGANSGYVNIWYDQSGNAVLHNMVQVTNGNQPRIVNAGALDTKNSIAAIRHIAASSNYLSAATAYLGTNFWTVNVVEALDGGANQRMLSGAANWLLGFWNASEQSYYYNGTNNTITYNSGVTPTYLDEVYTAIGQGAATGLQYCNGIAFTNGSSAPSNPPTTLYTSGYQTSSEFSNGAMQELLVFASALSNADQSTVECSQNNYYSISPTIASVGVKQSMCGTLTSNGLGGNTPASGSGLWTQVSGPGTTTFNNSAFGNSTATATAFGNYVYKWTVTNGLCTVSANISVSYAAGGVNPTATMSGSTASCAGTAVTLSIALTGVSPWDLSYTDGTNFYNATGIVSSPYTFTIAPLVSTTYNVSVLTDASCTALPANLFGSAVITIPTVLGTTASAAAAYSIRKLTGCYAGAAMQVRRSSDNELRDVYFDGTGVISLSSPVSAAGGGAATATTLTTWLGVNSGFVKIWYDQTGNGRDMSQGTNGNQPRIVNAGALDTKTSLNATALPAIRHIAASSNYLSAATAYLSTNFWTISVVEGLDGGANQRMLSGAANWLLGFWNANERSYYYNGSSSGSSFGSGVAATTNDEIYIAIGQGASTAVQYLNNASYTNGATAPSTPPTSLYTSGYISSNSEFSNGTMQELIIYASSVSNTDLSIIENNQGNYFGVLVLPIELLSFTAAPSTEKVDVKWETVTETDNNYFTIERSSDGQTFTELTRVPSKANHGNSTSALSYQIEDTKPLNGTSYYRLKQTDYNGDFKSFNIASVNFEAGNNVTFSVYPNPNSGEFTIDFSGIENNHEVQIIIHDGLGKEVYSQSVYSNSISSNRVKIVPTAAMAKGNYECSIICEGIKRTLVVIVN